MVYAEDAAAIEKARTAFARRWKLRCPPVIASFDEAGDELFTFTRFPKSQWKALRTTNALERITGEFRRTKTQSSLPSSDAVLLLLFGLLRSGAVKLRRMDGWEECRAPRHGRSRRVLTPDGDARRFSTTRTTRPDASDSLKLRAAVEVLAAATRISNADVLARLSSLERAAGMFR